MFPSLKTIDSEPHIDVLNVHSVVGSLTAGLIIPYTIAGTYALYGDTAAHLGPNEVVSSTAVTCNSIKGPDGSVAAPAYGLSNGCGVYSSAADTVDFEAAGANHVFSSTSSLNSIFKDTTVSDTTDATDTSTGAIIVSGGAGIAKKLYANSMTLGATPSTYFEIVTGTLSSFNANPFNTTPSITYKIIRYGNICALYVSAFTGTTSSSTNVTVGTIPSRFLPNSATRFHGDMYPITDNGNVVWGGFYVDRVASTVFIFPCISGTNPFPNFANTSRVFTSGGTAGWTQLVTVYPI